MDFDVCKKLVDYDEIQKFRDRALNPEHPVTRGTAQMMIYISKLEKLKTNFMMQYLI